MACARVALDQCGINVEKYYASEIDKYAIQIAKANYPDIIHIGDVREVTGEVYQDIDLLCGGSPCQGFSFAGKQLNFEDPRSALFFEFVRVLKEVKPKYFLLENVRMKKEFQDVISEYLGVEPIMINSALVSAQNRVRLYWTNIPNIEQPKDKGLVLKDILDTDVEFLYYAGKQLQKNHDGGDQLNPSYRSQANTIHQTNKPSPTICAGTHGYALGYIKDDGMPRWLQLQHNGRKRIEAVKTTEEKGLCLTATTHKGRVEGYVKKPIKVGMNVQKVKVRKHEVDITNLQYLLRVMKKNCGKTNKPSNTLTSGSSSIPKVSLVQRARGFSKGVTRSMENKSTTITTSNWQNNNHIVRDLHYRKLTPLECERLQTLPDNYTDGVSNTQRYKMIGNGWTVEVIKHIFNNLK